MKTHIEGHNTMGARLRAWRKGVPLTLMVLSKRIGVSQGSLSDLENDKSLPSATTLASLSMHTDLNVYWLLNGKGPVVQRPDKETKETVEESQSYEKFLMLTQDRKLKKLIEMLMQIYSEGKKADQDKISSFLSALR